MNYTNTSLRVTLARGTAVFPDSWLNFHWRAMAKGLKNWLKASITYEAVA